MGGCRSAVLTHFGKRKVIGSLLPVLFLMAAGCSRSAEEPAAAAAATQGLPAGFELSEFATELGVPRFMAFGPDTGVGHRPGVMDVPTALYVTSIRAGTVLVLPDRDQDGKADEVVTFAEGLKAPHGLAWQDPSTGLGVGDWLYVGETHRVVRLRDTDADGRADQQEVVVAELPPREQHFTRTVGFGPDGGLYVSVGSSCNVCEEEDERRAAILRYESDGTGMEIYARGLRNAVGFTWHPETQEMWATVNGRDWLGDDLPPEELNRIERGGDYGWPYCYGQRIPDPDMGSEERCAETQPATFEMPAHTAPLGLAFYTGEMFPPEYRGDLFIAFHGSWNRSVPVGYKLVRVRYQEGRPVELEDFVDVWFKGGRASHRPVDVVTGPDGALYISDDQGGTIFRLAYHGK